MKASGGIQSTITKKGQATIPKPVRDHLHLGPGDKIKFFRHPDGTVVILPNLPITALKGIIASNRAIPPTIEEMDESVEAGVAEEYVSSNPR